jgi:hypothetical protein
MRQVISWRPVYCKRDLYPSHNPPDGFRTVGAIMVSGANRPSYHRSIFDGQAPPYFDQYSDFE